jgi:hypothetical protein
MQHLDDLIAYSDAELAAMNRARRQTLSYQTLMTMKKKSL